MERIYKQILPLNDIIKFRGKVARADSRRRLELSTAFRKIFNDLDEDCYYVIEVSMSKEKMLERLREMVEKDGILPAFVYFCRNP